jgi:hypothetical protein
MRVLRRASMESLDGRQTLDAVKSPEVLSEDENRVLEGLGVVLGQKNGFASIDWRLRDIWRTVRIHRGSVPRGDMRRRSPIPQRTYEVDIKQPGGSVRISAGQYKGWHIDDYGGSWGQLGPEGVYRETSGAFDIAVSFDNRRAAFSSLGQAYRVEGEPNVNFFYDNDTDRPHRESVPLSEIPEGPVRELSRALSIAEGIATIMLLEH